MERGTAREFVIIMDVEKREVTKAEEGRKEWEMEEGMKKGRGRRKAKRGEQIAKEARLRITVKGLMTGWDIRGGRGGGWIDITKGREGREERGEEDQMEGRRWEGRGLLEGRGGLEIWKEGEWGGSRWL
jgi:hypothetical protein